MKQSKHTQGPWNVYFNTKKPMVRAKSGRMIAQSIPHPGDAPIGMHYSDEDLANAQLIAAAPEMFDALVATLTLIEDQLQNRPLMTKGELAEIEKLITLIEDAVAKAKGE